MSEHPDYDDPLPQHEVVTEFPEQEDVVPDEEVEGEKIRDPFRE
ncbi:hypothetical protein Q3V30_11490 [Erwinia pyri]|uniref:Uncharacterized protein n=1 Tax=Erwinia pyri TaxID=3062598 RepID=A0AA50DJF9_9GAMM|nr:hypothetical protein [Erwinia sp. DE2]WLS77115.1 hypothetical protein Q3V30_11490 [Erwinia sp. DE2]